MISANSKSSFQQDDLLVCVIYEEANRSVTRMIGKITLATVLVGTITMSSWAADNWQDNAEKYNKIGSIAAGFADISNGKATEKDINTKFEEFGPDVFELVSQWSKDEELKGAAPAFRRFLLFDYLTKGSDIIAAATNPPELLINVDAGIDAILADFPEAMAWGQKQMKDVIEEPAHAEFDNVQVSVFPMIPHSTKAANCIACHASPEVGRPYPEGQKVLGYTVVAQPKSK